MIRGNNTSKQCPFGLEIPFACKNAGGSVSHMVQIEESQDEEKMARAVDSVVDAITA